MVILKFLNSKCLPAQRNEKENRTNEIISVDSFILSHIHVHVYVCVSELVTCTAYILPYYHTTYC